jgi:hypothetical protein
MNVARPRYIAIAPGSKELKTKTTRTGRRRSAASFPESSALSCAVCCITDAASHLSILLQHTSLSL